MEIINFLKKLESYENVKICYICNNKKKKKKKKKIKINKQKIKKK